MLRVCSNGVHFQTRFSLHLKRLLIYSTSSSSSSSLATGETLSMVDFMVKSLGLSRQEAVTTWSKVSDTRVNFSTEKSYLVVDFLGKQGLNNAQIKKLVSSWPQVLACKIDENLIPKFNAFEELGISGSNLVDIIVSNHCVLKSKFTTRVVPLIGLIKSISGSNEKLYQVLRSAHWLFNIDFATKIQPNVELCRKYGFSNDRILNLLMRHGNIFGHDPKKLEEYMIMVDKELGIPLELDRFREAIVVFASTSENNREAKRKVFRSFGWSDLDIMTMLRKSPRCLGSSELSIRERLDFYMNKLGCKPGYLAKHPYVMFYSLKDRVLPRFTLLQGLEERKVITVKLGIASVVSYPEPLFLKKFVLPYEEKLPELCKAYYTHRVMRTWWLGAS